MTIIFISISAHTGVHLFFPVILMKIFPLDQAQEIIIIWMLYLKFHLFVLHLVLKKSIVLKFDIH